MAFCFTTVERPSPSLPEIKVNRLTICTIVSGVLLSACSTNSRVQENNFSLDAAQFFGVWATGEISNGEGSYLEESFRSDGTYCALSIEVAEPAVVVFRGSWSIEDNLLVIAARDLKDELSKEESREILRASAKAFSFHFSPLPDVFEMKKLTSAESHRWCNP
jgi:hypothetical protein